MKRVTSNPESKPLKGITIALKVGTLDQAKEQMEKDGLSWVNDLVQILLLLWLQGRVSKKLKASRPSSSQGPFPWRVNVRVRPEIMVAARDGAKRMKLEGGMTELIRFLLESYGERKIELCLRRGESE